MRLAADASALVAEALRERGRALITEDDLDLYMTPPTWSEVVYEIGRRCDEMVQRGHAAPERRQCIFDEAMTVLTNSLTIVPDGEYAEYEAEARDRIPRDAQDWPTMALAVKMGVGIWTADKDFFGCGVPVWTTQPLLTHVATGRARRDA
ncbi:MAG: PIN domain-containing protein [Chloroflexota bacterium]